MKKNLKNKWSLYAILLLSHSLQASEHLALEIDLINKQVKQTDAMSLSEIPLEKFKS